LNNEWKVKHTKTFYQELARLPKRIRTRIEKIAFGDEISKDPFLGGRIKKLQGYDNFYKCRVGNYRVGLFINQNERVIEFRRAVHRREIYRRFP